jgi:formylglycine-generating enzyme required for sulfatase activity
MQNVEQIRARILAHETPKAQPYKVTIPNTTVSYDMVPVAAGDFEMGSTAKPDEQPKRKVHLDAFAMQAHEVTWDEYRLFMFANQAGETGHKDNLVDAVSRPTRPYVEMSFGMGINGYPAISMTQHAANKYAEWLSAKTGEFYRLPTEAEWEYACRAGGPPLKPDAKALDQIAWFADNAGNKTHAVGKKEPNAWGLYDMLGNVGEYVIRDSRSDKGLLAGGSYKDEAKDVNSSAREPDTGAWLRIEEEVPPTTSWLNRTVHHVGFRVVMEE